MAMSMSEVIAKAEDMAKMCRAKSNGDWDAFKYTILQAEQVRKFVDIVSVYGNSLTCSQDTVDGLEDTIRQFGTFAAFKKAHPQMATLGLSRGYVFLFASMHVDNIHINPSTCAKQYVIHTRQKDGSWKTTPVNHDTLNNIPATTKFKSASEMKAALQKQSERASTSGKKH
jgi:hypothetical protein